MKEIVKQVSDDFKISSGEAELIVASLLEKPRFGIYFNNRMDINTKKILNMKLIQLKKGVPIEYITKKIQFRNFLLRIYPGVFIPRLETEYLIELIEKFVNLRPEKILEIGTGSGAICITLATIFPKAKIIATDISQNAINCASENIERYNLTEQINLLHCNMFEGLTTKFDLIVTNPPYIVFSLIFIDTSCICDIFIRKWCDFNTLVSLLTCFFCFGNDISDNPSLFTLYCQKPDLLICCS
ncbi:Release factor glutamine methyltransferase [subsurface metagenome]